MTPNKKVDGFVHLTNFHSVLENWYKECIAVFARHGIVAKIGEPMPYKGTLNTVFGFWVEDSCKDVGVILDECDELPSSPKVNFNKGE